MFHPKYILSLFVHSPYGGEKVTLRGGADNDTLYNDGNNALISGGLDNDIIVLSEEAQNNLIEYKPGDGYDTLDGLKATDTIQIGNGTSTYSTQISNNGNHIIVNVGTGQILLWNAVSLSSAVNIEGLERASGEKDNIIPLTNDDEFYFNTLEGAVIYLYGGNDLISNTGNNIYIYDIAGDDTIESNGLNGTIKGGKGDDQISLLSGSRNNMVLYSAGDGNDTVWGFDEKNELSIEDGNYIRYMVGNDLVFAVGTESVRLVDAATLSAYVPYGKGVMSRFIDLTEGDDYFINNGVNATIQVFSDEQPIISDIGAGATINGRDGNDKLENLSPYVSISGGAGNDQIRNSGNDDNSVTISGGDGDDTIDNDGNDVSIDGGEGKNYIYNHKFSDNNDNNVTINTGTGDDFIRNDSGNNVTKRHNQHRHRRRFHSKRQRQQCHNQQRRRQRFYSKQQRQQRFNYRRRRRRRD